MNKQQTQVAAAILAEEKKVLDSLKQYYQQAANDAAYKIQLHFDKMIVMLNDWDNLDEQQKSIVQSQIYQREYQISLKSQLDLILYNLDTKQYNTVEEYLKDCYENGFVGTMYDIQGQGIPLVLPIDQKAAAKAAKLDSKISKKLYGSYTNELKKRIQAEITRGIASNITFNEIARNINMQSGIGYNKAMRIARTEGHNVQIQATVEAQQKAKDAGADIVKQWDAALDGRTRDSHRMVDGQIRELDEKFSNGMKYPSDPAGGAAEVINCRCALLQRAKWALDDEELEILKDRAKYYGIDKTADFDDFKNKYLQASQTAQPQQKKEYLTEKKLQEKIKQADDDIDDLNKKFKTESGGWDYDEVINDFGSLEDFADGDDLKALKAIKAKIDDIELQKTDYQEKLNKKLVAKETKKLKKEKADLIDEQKAFKDELSNKPNDIYSGIWKDDVTTSDYGSKMGSIEAKKKYFEGKYINETDPAKMQQWLDMHSLVSDFEKKGSEYYALQQKIIKAEQSIKQIDSKLAKIKKDGIIPSSTDDAFTQARKDAALWFDKSNGGFHEADKYFDPPVQEIYKNASRQEFNGFYTYTSASGGHNRPLAGFQKPWGNGWDSGWEPKYYKGSKKVWIDYEGKGDEIRGLTTLIEKSTYDKDVWLQSGQGFGTLEGVTGIPYGSLQTMSDAELQQLVGQRIVFQQFISSAVNEGGGSVFNEKPMKFNIYVPKGSQMLYASDKGSYGKGENEMILQRGGTYEITKAYWGTDMTDGGVMKIFVDMELHPEVGYDLFQQDPSEWKGSRKNYTNP